MCKKQDVHTWGNLTQHTLILKKYEMNIGKRNTHFVCKNEPVLQYIRQVTKIEFIMTGTIWSGNNPLKLATSCNTS